MSAVFTPEFLATEAALHKRAELRDHAERNGLWRDAATSNLLTRRATIANFRQYSAEPESITGFGSL